MNKKANSQTEKRKEEKDKEKEAGQGGRRKEEKRSRRRRRKRLARIDKQFRVSANVFKLLLRLPLRFQFNFKKSN